MTSDMCAVCARSERVEQVGSSWGLQIEMKDTAAPDWSRGYQIVRTQYTQGASGRRDGSGYCACRECMLLQYLLSVTSRKHRASFASHRWSDDVEREQGRDLRRSDVRFSHRRHDFSLFRAPLHCSL